MSDQYGAGSSKVVTPADRAANAANAIGSTGGGMSGVVAAGVSSATTRPSSPILPGGVGAASTRSPGAPTSPQMAGKQPAYTPKPSAVPAEDLKRYADAYEKVKAQDAAKAAADAGGAPTAAGKLNGRSMLADQTGGSGVMGGMKAPQATASSPLMTPQSTATAAVPQQPAAPTTSAPAPSAATQPSGPSEQDIKAQEEKAAASQRGYVGNAAGRVTELNGKPYKSPLASDMGLPPPGQNGPIDTAAKNAARGFNDAADLARYKEQDAASGTSPLMQPSNTPQGGSQMADAAAAEEEARRLKEQQ